MKRFLYLLSLLILVSCTQIEATQPPAETVNTEVSPTRILLSPTSVASITPTSTQTPCDPFRESFCIIEGHFFLKRPIRPPANDRVDPSYRYASTANGTREPHHGVEFPNPSGTPVHAAADGTVLFAGFDKEAIYSPWQNYYGNLVVIQHDDDLFTLYAHLSKVDVQIGKRVFTGEKLGEVGRTGVAIGSHLHFEVRRGNSEDYFATQNPELWLVPAKDADGNPFGILRMSVVDGSGTLIKYAEFTMQHYRIQSEPLVNSYYGSTYSSDMLNGEENAVLGELHPGRYRIVVDINGQFHERWVEVESGKLTHAVFVVR